MHQLKRSSYVDLNIYIDRYITIFDVNKNKKGHLQADARYEDVKTRRHVPYRWVF